MSEGMRELLDLYEADGGEDLYDRAKQLYEAALAETPHNALLLRDYGYLLECHGRRTLGAATASYERALALDPGSEKIRLQLLHARAALGRHEEAIARCHELLASRPDDVVTHRCLATAYVAARDFTAAERVIAGGLALGPRDPRLVELRGDMLAASGRSEDALAHWREAFALDSENLSPRYSVVFLLQREERLEEAAEEWRAILSWCEARDYALDAEWPRRELARLETRLSA